jgi:hypothetical protein
MAELGRLSKPNRHQIATDRPGGGVLPVPVPLEPMLFRFCPSTYSRDRTKRGPKVNGQDKPKTSVAILAQLIFLSVLKSIFNLIVGPPSPGGPGGASGL